MFAPIMILGTVQTATRPKALWVGGVDVIKQATYAVPIDSVMVDHMGPGGVSSMEFTVECSTVRPVVITDSMDVRFYNNTAGWTDFYGFVDHVDIENMDGGVSTRYRVRCTGIEAVLDWSVIAADTTIAAGTAMDTAVQAAFAAATGSSLGRLRDFSSGTSNSTDANPVQSLGVSGAVVTSVAVTLSAGTTLREAVRQIVGALPVLFFSGIRVGYRCTVDFLGGLRFFDDYGVGTGVGADQWSFQQVDNDAPFAGGTVVGEDTAYGIDAAQVRAVMVKGTGVSQLVTDGTGKEGATAVLVDATITTTAAALLAGAAYLASYVSTARGQLTLSDYTSFGAGGQPARPGGYFANGLTDARLGLATAPFAVGEVVKTYNPSGRENWVISFGGLAPSVTALTRQLTRTTLS